jgi:CBS domain-containing protein
MEVRMTTVREILQAKGTDVFTIAPDKTVRDALTLMAEKKIGALVVVDDDGVCGMVSERDYARKVVLKGKASRDTAIRDIMTSKVCYVSPDNRIEECMALMTDKIVRHLPVMEDGKLSGIVSIGDVVKSVISDQEFIISQLESYIMGN